MWLLMIVNDVLMCDLWSEEIALSQSFLIVFYMDKIICFSDPYIQAFKHSSTNSQRVSI